MAMRTEDRPLAEMLLFISERSEGDERFGAVKLNKLLFYSDFSAFLLHGKSITGQEYQKLENGPAPRRLLWVRRELVKQKALAIRKVEYFNRHQDRTFALREPDLCCFTAEQIALVTRIIHENWNCNATEISERSHRFHGWEDAKPGETIPYEVALVSNRPPTAKEAARCRKDARKAAEFLAGTAVTHDA